ncbi:amino acid aminotransferase [Roseitranquillus sediminis]|uniref:amino acid aminotransferase n=1 Tax=Roseitranquillus sediminis TaxID=2809051 RepID=UPI001D0CB88E|nr:amino acid aminotransferase [Roseitranquillus sediminis]MBM9593145.1 aspartate/tyrosine/aromatic aminotransferase [Roseitranquillus sediminis]
MLSDLKELPQDKILALVGMFRADPRDDKIDLGLGVYRDAEGRTPVMRAVKAAERRLWESQETKAYTSLGGDPAYREAMRKLVLADAVEPERVASAATPGGTGAVRMAFELLGMAAPEATAWLPAETWPNHVSILRHLGRPTKTFRYFDAETGLVDFEGLIADLEGAQRGDLVVLHGCCHNPTGADPDIGQWEAIADTLASTGAIPMIDLAYQGFGDGLDADAAGTRLLASKLPETLIAASCSKNFGIYRERTGILFAVAEDAAARDLTQPTLEYLNRQNYSFPPDHGARVVTTVLEHAALREDWKAELEQIRDGMLSLRRQLASELRQRLNSDRFDFIAEHRGMFSRLGVTGDEVLALRERHGVYLVGDGRMNVAGLNAHTVPLLASAIADVIG